MKAAALTVLALATLTSLPAAHAASVTTVMSNLDNPRGLAFGPEGALYVVEAGRGGAGPCATLRGVPRCYGPSGAITRLWHGTQQRVVEGLPSYTDPAGAEITGAHDIAFVGRGNARVTVGFGADPAERAGFGELGALFGTLLRVTPDGAWRVDADVSAHEGANNPAGGPVDTNPYGVAADGGAHVVADAGANALLRVSARGDIETLAVFPSRPARSTDAVPTTVVRGPDGAWYIGELTGVPFADGSARVYRLEPGGEPEVHLGGFKTIIDMAFGADGSLYVLQHATGALFFGGPGQIVRVAPDGSRSLVVGGLERPTALAVGDDGALYVSNRGASIATGEVLKVVP
ncbi:ScyD/ScyE family protein [Cognatilysobacter tabacisoli]|uniref:ScyD/ScyE family protein n=1 Tax=Cognatilysobacter tabacisoli TaxID=2315424 RepID=UPI000E6B0C6C|nr:ScyD/ScyE family protein [Lysobacter tabacisoli]